MGEKLPYWGDSIYADRADYRKDTPFGIPFDGVTVAQMMIFGLFWIESQADGTIKVNPHLGICGEMALRNVKMRGVTFDVLVKEGKFQVASIGERENRCLARAFRCEKIAPRIAETADDPYHGDPARDLTVVSF